MFDYFTGNNIFRSKSLISSRTMTTNNSDIRLHISIFRSFQISSNHLDPNINNICMHNVKC